MMTDHCYDIPTWITENSIQLVLTHHTVNAGGQFRMTEGINKTYIAIKGYQVVYHKLIMEKGKWDPELRCDEKSNVFPVPDFVIYVTYMWRHIVITPS